MRQQFYIDNWVSLKAPAKLNDEASFSAALRFEKEQLPKLDWVVPMQRRRLSPFAKMALYCAYQASAEIAEPLPSIFCSRHGDLHKTSILLADLVQSESLSPTAFSLSVHNAVSGLFTILTKNKQATNTVVAGSNTLLMAIVDGYARLNSGHADQLLVVHCDQALPDIYLSYADELQIDHAVAFIISRESVSPHSIEVDINDLTSAVGQMSSNLPQALKIEEWLTQSCALNTSS